MTPLTKRAEYTAALLAVLIPVISGTLWIGSVASTAQGAEQSVDELKADLKQVPSDVAVLKSNVTDLKQTINDMRHEQKERDDALLAAVKAAGRPSR